MELSIINDEISENIDEQISFLIKNELKHVELRTINKVNIFSMDLNEASKAVDTFREAGIQIVCLSTTVGKGEEIRNNEDLNIYKDKVIKAVNLADLLKVNKLRIFMPRKGKTQIFKLIVEQFKKINYIAKKNKITIVIENEPHSYFITANNIRKFYKNFAQSNIQLLWDTGNWIEFKDQVYDYNYKEHYEYIDHFHIKDYDGVNKRIAKLTEGTADLKTLITFLKHKDYQGILSLEPLYNLMEEIDEAKRISLLEKGIKEIKLIINE